MKCFSLFSGIGGFDLALTRQGHELVGACEIDKYARQVYSRHFPTVKIWEDATKIRPEELPDFDLLCGGFPCQSFSLAGRRRGFDDTRGTLFFEIARITKEKRPSYLFLENVEGLLSHDRGRTFGIIISTLDELGYDVEWQVINSKYFVPQTRKRLFIIGHLRGKPIKQVFPIFEGHAMFPRKDCVGQIQQGIQISYRVGIEKRDVSGTIDTMYRKGLPARGQPRIGVLIGNMIRKLSQIELERLQGFPDNYTESLSYTRSCIVLGNAVTVPVIECIVEKLAR